MDEKLQTLAFSALEFFSSKSKDSPLKILTLLRSNTPTENLAALIRFLFRDEGQNIGHYRFAEIDIAPKIPEDVGKRL